MSQKAHHIFLETKRRNFSSKNNFCDIDFITAEDMKMSIGFFLKTYNFINIFVNFYHHILNKFLIIFSNKSIFFTVDEKKFNLLSKAINAQKNHQKFINLTFHNEAELHEKRQ